MTASDRGILFLLCLNDRGGAEISSIKLAQGLQSRGRRVALAVYGAYPDLARDLGFKGEIIKLGARRSVGALLPLRALLCSGRFAVVISALTHTNIVALAAACLANKKIRVIATEHGNDGLAACAASPFFSLIARNAYGRAAAIVTVSQGLAQGWRVLVPSSTPVVTIYNAVVPDILPCAPPPAHGWLADPDIQVIMGIGRLKEEKNFVLLLRAFVRLTADRDVRLVILGEGEQRPMLESLALEFGLHHKILLPGFVADIAGWLDYAALFVSSSQREGFGNAIVEALARGVPVVATDCPFGPAEILEDGRYGRLVPMDREDILAQAMHEALSSVKNTQEGQSRAMTFTVSRCIDAYLKLIDNPLS